MPVAMTVYPDRVDDTQTVTLDKVQYRARFRWRERTGRGLGRWYMDLFTLAGVPIFQGRALEAGTPVGVGYAFDGGPAGKFLVRGPTPYRRTDFGSPLVVLYFSESEVIALQAAVDTASSNGLSVSVEASSYSNVVFFGA